MVSPARGLRRSAYGLVAILVLAACSGTATSEPEVNGSAAATESSTRSTQETAGSTVTSSPSTSTSSAPPVAGAVSTVAQLEAALESAGPGDVIDLADGVYQRDGGDRWAAEVSGTQTAPITLRGSSAAVLESDSPDGDYGLHITGSYWRIEGISVRNATKGIVLDGSVGTVLDGVEVSQVGDEGVHFRMCSSDGVLRNSFIHDTGIESPQYGEGAYAGSANSNWGDYGCGPDGEDDTERTLIEDNVFQNIPAEGVDLKEGTDSGTVRGNTFDNVGFSGENSADSAVDAKGNHWQITGNTVVNPSGAFEDAYQSHTVYSGYGEQNYFDGNVVEGDLPGVGFGLYPEAGNIVTCDNSADGAAGGLVGANGSEITCTP